MAYAWKLSYVKLHKMHYACIGCDIKKINFYEYYEVLNIACLLNDKSNPFKVIRLWSQ